MSAPDQSRNYFPQPRTRATAPADDAPTMLDAIKAWVAEWDCEDES